MSEIDTRTWEELTEVEQLQSIFSDIHKDAYGFRPRWMSTDQRTDATWLKSEIDSCEQELKRVMEREAIEEKEAIQAFEERVKGVIESGAGDRETAIRWIDQAEDCNGDREYLCYTLRLPYGYFKEAA